MSIKFIEGNDKFCFRDVGIDQFFVSKSGELCQKISSSSYQVVAKSDGTPFADHVEEESSSTPIERMLPRIEKIEF